MTGDSHPLDSPRSVAPLGSRRLLLAAIALAGLACAWQLELMPSAVIPGKGGRALTGKFLSAAFTPALSYQSDYVSEGTPPLWSKAVASAWLTVQLAAAAMGLSIILGAVLGFAGSTAWWRRDLERHPSGTFLHFVKKLTAPAIYACARMLGTMARSIHELIWAVLFLALFGLTPLVAVVALTIPFSGTLAKIFSEMIDEAPDDAARALGSMGAHAPQIFIVGLLPRVLPDLLSYTLYRFECGLRSSAVMGFMGIPTLGLLIRQSHENAYYGEVWTYLYVLLSLVVGFELWGSALRKRLRGEVSSTCRRSL